MCEILGLKLKESSPACRMMLLLFLLAPACVSCFQQQLVSSRFRCGHTKATSSSDEQVQQAVKALEREVRLKETLLRSLDRELDTVLKDAMRAEEEVRSTRAGEERERERLKSTEAASLSAAEASAKKTLKPLRDMLQSATREVASAQTTTDMKIRDATAAERAALAKEVETAAKDRAEREAVLVRAEEAIAEIEADKEKRIARFEKRKFLSEKNKTRNGQVFGAALGFSFLVGIALAGDQLGLSPQLTFITGLSSSTIFVLFGTYTFSNPLTSEFE